MCFKDRQPLQSKLKKITLIYSGGSDSFTLLNYAISKKINVDCLTFSYGQKHKKEIDFASQVCKEANLKHNINYQTLNLF